METVLQQSHKGYHNLYQQYKSHNDLWMHTAYNETNMI